VDDAQGAVLSAPRTGRPRRAAIARDDGTTVDSPIARVRLGAGLSQAGFARLLGVSVRTLQQWEQGRREPSGAARTLLRIAERHPQVLSDLEAA
jgi:putative transcriptional regulator